MAKDGIEYFQIYYQHWLLFVVTLSMLGWIVFLQQRISSNRSYGSEMLIQWKSFTIVVITISITICAFIYCKYCVHTIQK